MPWKTIELWKTIQWQKHLFPEIHAVYINVHVNKVIKNSIIRRVSPKIGVENLWHVTHLTSDVCSIRKLVLKFMNQNLWHDQKCFALEDNVEVSPCLSHPCWVEDLLPLPYWSLMTTMEVLLFFIWIWHRTINEHFVWYLFCL